MGSIIDLPIQKTAFLPKLASRLIKIYFMAVLGLGLFLWMPIIFNFSVNAVLIVGIWDIFCRAGILLLLFFGVVAVQQSIR